MSGSADVRRAVVDVIRRERPWLEELLIETLRAPSVTGDEALVTPLYEAALRDIGLDVHQLVADRARVGDAFSFWDQEQRLEGRPNVIGRWRTDAGGAPLVLNGHVDVVPPGDEAVWTHPPFAAVVRDGRVYARGAADMKGGLAGAIAGVRALRLMGLEPRGDVEVQCVMAEETGGLGSIAACVDGDAPAGVVAFEPTDLAIASAQAGLLKVTIDVAGRASHTSVPWNGVSALEKLMVVYEALSNLAAERSARVEDRRFERLPSRVPFAIGLATAGHFPWILPDRASASGRIGVMPGESLEEARATIEARVAEVAANDPWLADHPPTIRWAHGSFAPWSTPADAAVLHAFRAGVIAAGLGGDEIGVVYGTDVSHFARLRGTPGLVFGPGRIEEAHIPNESVALADVVRTAEVVALALLEWEGGRDVAQ